MSLTRFTYTIFVQLVLVLGLGLASIPAAPQKVTAIEMTQGRRHRVGRTKRLQLFYRAVRKIKRASFSREYVVLLGLNLQSKLPVVPQTFQLLPQLSMARSCLVDDESDLRF